MKELIFEKEIELLQSVKYPTKSGGFRDTKNVILKAPTFLQSEKLETAMRQLNYMTAMANFICESHLIISKDDGQIIPPSALNELHIKAVRDLVAQYSNFFLASEPLDNEKKSES